MPRADKMWPNESVRVWNTVVRQKGVLPSGMRAVTTAGPLDGNSPAEKKQRCALPLRSDHSHSVRLSGRRQPVSHPKLRGLIIARMNSHHNRLMLKVFQALFSSLCAPCCPFCAVFVSPQCNAHL